MSPAFRSAPSRAATMRVAVVALAAGALAACGGAEAPPAAEAATTPARDTATFSDVQQRLVGLATAAADTQPWRETWEVPARLTTDPDGTETLGSNVEGRVKRVFVLPGDAVRPGQVLVTLHSHEMNDARGALGRARAAIAEADDALRLASANAERAERLYALRALSQADLERARSARVQARAMRQQAASEMERASSFVEHLVGSGPVPPGVDDHDVLIRTPIAGTVTSRAAAPGTVVLPGAPLVTVSRLGGLVLQLHLPERAMAAAQEGATVRFTVPAWPGRTFTATVTRVSPVVDSLSRAVEVLAKVPSGDGALRAEMSAAALLDGAAGAPALVVPAAAVQAFEGDTVVLTATPLAAAAPDGAAPNGRAPGGDAAGPVRIEAVAVRVGRRTARHAEILAGISPGTRVVTGGAAIAKAELLKRRGGGESEHGH